MQAAVAVWFGILDVILALDQRDIILPQQAVCETVDVLGERADDTNPCNIKQVVFDGFQCKWKAAPLDFCGNAFRTFEAGFDGFNRVVFTVQGQLDIEHAEFCLHLHDRTAVIGHQTLKGFRHGCETHEVGFLRDQLCKLFYVVFYHISQFFLCNWEKLQKLRILRCFPVVFIIP